MTQGCFEYFDKIVNIQQKHSLELSKELMDIVKTDMKRFSGEMRFGFINIFKDIKFIKGKIEEMKQDFTFT